MSQRQLLGACLVLSGALWACSEPDAEEERDGAEPAVLGADAEARGADAGASSRDGGGTSARLDAGDARPGDSRDARATDSRDARALPETGAPDPEAGPREAGPREAGAQDARAGSDAALADSGSELTGWKLVWSDEFDGPAGALLDASRWVYEVGGTGWGNNQLEFDTNRPENASLSGTGELVITARKEAYMGREYTGARLKTQGKFEHGYGRYEARLRIPFGQGIWPAFWMLGSDIGSAGWPTCGEIDIMENIGREPDTIHGTVHGPGYSGGAGIGMSSKVPAGQRYADAYHVFAIEWEKDVLRWYVDGKLYQTRTPRDLPANARWVYDHNFFILLNLAVGGQWPGNPDATTTFPQTLTVDYVRVYDRAP